MSQKLY